MDTQSASLLIYDEAFLLERIKGHEEFYPKDVAVIFIKEGRLSFLVNGKLFQYSAGNVLIISPRNIYQLKSISKGIKLFIVGVFAAGRNYFNYNFNRFNVYQAVRAEQNSAIMIPKEDLESFWGVLKYMHHISQKKSNIPYREEIVINSFGAVAYSIASFLENSIIKDANDGAANSRKEDITMRFMELASNHFIEEKELKFYAAKLFISVKYLSICVKDVSGHPPTHFLNQFLIEEACKRLANKNNSIADVAYGIGFADQFVFSKFFRKHLGQTPSDFRKRIGTIHTI